MRKALTRKFSGSSKLGRVFNRQKSGDVSKEGQMSLDSLESLKEEIDSLKTALNALKIDLENKESKLGKLAREKEKLSMSLAKMKRSNDNLARQLEDERDFYYKEKETYCHEMTEFKKLKKALSNTTLGGQVDLQEVEKLKKTLEQTLQTNYNLSVKFLRMKETKNQFKTMLEKTEDKHRRVVNDLRTKIETLTSELKQILDTKFEAPLSPSNKKYLQLVNQNSSLVYENLYLQMQIDNWNAKTRHKSEGTIVKLYEREKRPDIPTVTILNEKEVGRLSERKIKLPLINDSKLEVFQVSELGSCDSVKVKKRSRSAPRIIQSVVTFE
ncbi:coiled-coil domain-containing protein 39-like [Tribolium madens]|uniref:coiled-coil domain-containing protein 39-like n=1 Tax=Tribolium madens TaxID=41895 RepID=UPI001CF72548|nr:coiled-coil domain-containing protein 39-like [Tribolium madens]